MYWHAHLTLSGHSKSTSIAKRYHLTPIPNSKFVSFFSPITFTFTKNDKVWHVTEENFLLHLAGKAHHIISNGYEKAKKPQF